MDKLYDLAGRYKDKSIGMEELIIELRGGQLKDWGGALAIIFAIIVVLNNIDKFEFIQKYIQNAYCFVAPPNLRHEDDRIQRHLHYPKVGGNIEVRMLNPNQNQCPSDATQVSNFYTNNRLDLQKAFAEVQRRASQISCDNFECSFERFSALAREAKKVTETGIREAIAALQGEMLGYYKDTVRGNYGKGVFGPDFKFVGLGDYSHITHLDVKNPVGSEIEKANRGVTDLRLQGQNIGAKFSKQQVNWSNTSFVEEKFPHANKSESFPETPGNMLGLVDTIDVPPSEKPIIQDSILNNSTNSSSIIFINNETNI